MTDYDTAIGIVREYIRHFKDEGHQATVWKLTQLIKEIEKAVAENDET